MAPMVHGLEAKYYGRIKFTYLDAGNPQTRKFQRDLVTMFSRRFTCWMAMETY